ncbi:MAG: hypothetical protein K2L56_03335, partial [Prevotella sp.]|nr:hypothetical protein [Prevotella sp.]
MNQICIFAFHYIDVCHEWYGVAHVDGHISVSDPNHRLFGDKRKGLSYRGIAQIDIKSAILCYKLKEK